MRQSRFGYLVGASDYSINYDQFMMMFAVAAKKSIKPQKDEIPLLLKMLGELIKDGWSKAAWYDYSCICNIFKIFKEEYPHCKKVVIEPPVFVTFQKNINTVEFFSNEDIELIGIMNETL